MRRKLHRPVVGGRRGGSGFRWGFGRRVRDFCGRRDRSRDWGIGGRGLSPGRAALGGPTRCSGRRDRARTCFGALPSAASGSGECNPPRRHPPANPHRLMTRRLTDRCSPSVSTPTRLPRSFDPRQSNIGRKWSRRRRLQKAGCHPQRKQHRGDPKGHQPSLRPTDPNTHPPLSPGAADVSPKAFREAPDRIRSAIPRPRVGLTRG